MMKTVFLKKWLLPGLAAAAFFGLAACSDDDGGTPPPPDPDTAVVVGTYTGTMTVVDNASGGGATDTPTDAATDTAGTTVTAEVTEDVVGFAGFPIRDLVVQIAGEDGADAIVEAVGEVDYAIPYAAVMSEDGSTVALALAPETLNISVAVEGSEPVEVDVTVSADTEGIYTVERGALNFSLTVEGIAVGGQALEGMESFTLEFDLVNDDAGE